MEKLIANSGLMFKIIKAVCTSDSTHTASFSLPLLLIHVQHMDVDVPLSIRLNVNTCNAPPFLRPGQAENEKQNATCVSSLSPSNSCYHTQLWIYAALLALMHYKGL